MKDITDVLDDIVHIYNLEPHPSIKGKFIDDRGFVTKHSGQDILEFYKEHKDLRNITDYLRVLQTVVCHPASFYKDGTYVESSINDICFGEYVPIVKEQIIVD